MIDVRRPLLCIGIGMGLVSAGCSSSSGDDHDGFSSDEWAAIQDMAPLAKPMIANPVNTRADDADVAKFGQKLFFDTGYAEAITADGNPAGKKGETGKVGCVSCHDPASYFVDGRVDPMTQQRITMSPSIKPANAGGRQAPMMINEGWYEWNGWTARFDSLVIHGSGVMGTAGSRLYVAHYVYSTYKDEYNRLFPNQAMDDSMNDLKRFPPTGAPKANAMAADGPWETMTPADQKFINQFTYNMARLWDTYPRKVTSHGSDFEKYVVNGDTTALSAAAKRGLKVFIGKAACNECHTGPILSDSKAHNVGVPTAPGVMTPDLGRYADIMSDSTRKNVFNGAGEYSDDAAAGAAKLAMLPTPAQLDDSMKGQFRTPSILNCEKTFPYFHTGQFQTLEKVIDHYDNGGNQDGSFAGNLDPKIKPLMLTGDEKADLLEFLKSLTGVLDPEWTTKPM
jgi:cytochrome c peroxidase